LSEATRVPSPKRRVADRQGAVMLSADDCGLLAGMPARVNPAMWRALASTDDYGRPFAPLPPGFFPPACHPWRAGRCHERPGPAFLCGFDLLAEGVGFEPTERLSDAQRFSRHGAVGRDSAFASRLCCLGRRCVPVRVPVKGGSSSSPASEATFLLSRDREGEGPGLALVDVRHLDAPS
jgi:hypothetical protein